MAIQFELRFARAGATGVHPWGNPFRIPGPAGVKPLEGIIGVGSRQEIDLRPVFDDSVANIYPTLSYLWPIDLHRALNNACQNPPGILPPPNLGLIFAPRYGPRPEIFGVMFDTGFLDEDQGGVPFQFWVVPREGCAVFIEAIRERRSDIEFERQVAYTTVHELAHMFNLQHTDGAQCFLDTSPAGDLAPPLTSFKFLEWQKNWMSQCPTDSRVRPGGTGFGSLDYFDGFRARQTPAAPDGLKLELRPSQAEFFRWEPVELEIVVALRGKSALKAAEIPDEIDPGYSSFIIWIIDPSGERRRYRPTKHYCSSTRTLEITQRNVFRRDVSIFGQSGGLTFHSPGEHGVWAEFKLSNGSVLRSDVVKVYVRDEGRRDGRARRRHEELRSIHRLASAALFYRSGNIRPSASKALEHLIKAGRGSPLGPAAQYALGRWLQHQARRSPRNAASWMAKARPFLLRARDSDLLDRHRRFKADQCLAEER